MARIYREIAFLLLGTMFLNIYAENYCPNNQVCDCNSDYINCTCSGEETIVFNTGDAFSGKEIIINGCGEIKLIKLSLENVNVLSITISNVSQLQIEPYAFDGGIITNFHISNITKLLLEPHCFAGIKNITSVIISNVVIENLERAVFAETAVPRLVIKDSQIEKIESQSLHFENIESVEITNNNISAIETKAIKISNINAFHFIHNFVRSTGFGSISVSKAKEVNLTYCLFVQISSNMILTKDIDVFTFSSNYVQICQEKAFWGIQTTKHVNFVYNQILVAEEDSLIPNLGPNELNSTVIVNENNKIGCDCKIQWLLTQSTSSYNSIKEKNVCHQPQQLQGLSLSLLIMSVDENGNCTSVYAPTTTGAAPMTTQPTKIEEQPSIFHTTGSSEQEKTQTTSSSTEQAKNPPTASHVKKCNNGEMCLSNTILILIMLVILVSRTD